MKISSKAHADLDDSRVLEIRRHQDEIAIELEQLRADAKRRISIVASQVTQEDAEYYIGADERAPHPDPAKPLDYVEFATFGQGQLELGGYLKNESWFSWRIVSNFIEIKE